MYTSLSISSFFSWELRWPSIFRLFPTFRRVSYILDCAQNFQFIRERSSFSFNSDTFIFTVKREDGNNYSFFCSVLVCFLRRETLFCFLQWYKSKSRVSCIFELGKENWWLKNCFSWVDDWKRYCYWLPSLQEIPILIVHSFDDKDGTCIFIVWTFLDHWNTPRKGILWTKWKIVPLRWKDFGPEGTFDRNFHFKKRKRFTKMEEVVPKGPSVLVSTLRCLLIRLLP